MSEDPKGFDAGDYNLFRYVGNDPLDRVDPMGLQEDHHGTNQIKQKQDEEISQDDPSVGYGVNEKGQREPMGVHDPKTGQADRQVVDASGKPPPEPGRAFISSRDLERHQFDTLHFSIDPHLLARFGPNQRMAESMDRFASALDTFADLSTYPIGGWEAEGIRLALGAAQLSARAIERQAAKTAAKAAFRREAGNLPRIVMRDTRHGGTERIKGVQAGNARYRPKLDGRYSVNTQQGKGVLHFPESP